MFHTILTHLTHILISIFLIEKLFFNEFFKFIGVKNHNHFCLDLVCNKILKARNSTPTHTNLSLLHIKSKQKVIRKQSLFFYNKTVLLVSNIS